MNGGFFAHKQCNYSENTQLLLVLASIALPVSLKGGKGSAALSSSFIENQGDKVIACT